MAGHDANTLVQTPAAPNRLADELPITDYPETTAQNVSGSLMADRNAIIDWFGRFLPVGFYYRAFYKPFGVWRWWERLIRKAAGLGVANLSSTPRYQDKQYLFCDVAVVGAGPAGLSAALKAAEGGASVLLVDEQPELGGSLTYHRFAIDSGAVRSEAEALIEDSVAAAPLREKREELERKLDGEHRAALESWPTVEESYAGDQYVYQVRGKYVRVPITSTTLSHQKVPKVSLPTYSGWGDLLKWLLQENLPGSFPFTAGVFPFKREGEDPTRMFAGEGGPERTNRRFHYVSDGLPARRLSTAFDSVTLYGNDPAKRPDIYGKIGNSGVSVCCLDDAKKLYSGFDLADPKTSVSMTINGPAPMLTAFFMNAAIDQQCEKYIKANGLEAEVNAKIDAYFKAHGAPRPLYDGPLPKGNDGLGLMLLGITGDQVLPRDVYDRIKAETISKVRGTVQADILKEDQAQNTCIFSTEF